MVQSQFSVGPFLHCHVPRSLTIDCSSANPNVEKRWKGLSRLLLENVNDYFRNRVCKVYFRFPRELTTKWVMQKKSFLRLRAALESSRQLWWQQHGVRPKVDFFCFGRGWRFGTAQIFSFGRSRLFGNSLRLSTTESEASAASATFFGRILLDVFY